MLRLILILLFLCYPSSAFAVTATFQEGVSSYTGTKDAVIFSGSTNEHWTTAYQTRAYADGIIYILYFDISSIPSNATVSSATIQLYINEQNCTDETMGVASIENPDNSGAFDSAATENTFFNDYATWAYKDHGATTDWDVAASNSFDDVNDNANEDTQTTGVCPGYAAKTWTITNMVQGWVTTPTSNGGMVFSLASTGKVDIRGRYYATSGERPLLTVNYTVPSGISVFQNISASGSLYIN